MAVFALGSSKWAGGDNWGEVEFDQSGLVASYTNKSGRPPGILQIVGFQGMSGYVLVAEWKQPGDSGSALIGDRDADKRLTIYWGPGFVHESEWQRIVP